jgi:hypothetical protein
VPVIHSGPFSIFPFFNLCSKSLLFSNLCSIFARNICFIPIFAQNLCSTGPIFARLIFPLYNFPSLNSNFCSKGLNLSFIQSWLRIFAFFQSWLRIFAFLQSWLKIFAQLFITEFKTGTGPKNSQECCERLTWKNSPDSSNPVLEVKCDWSRTEDAAH